MSALRDTVLLVCLTAAAGCAARVAPTQPAAPIARAQPSPGPAATPAAKALPAPADTDLPPPTRETLPNGMKLIIQEHRASDIVALHLWIGVGVRYEAPDGLGYAHFQEHMLFKGTDTWGPGYVDRAVEGVGGRSNAVTSFDYTTFYVLVPATRLASGIELLADMAFRSSFDPDEIGREREVIFEEARIEQDNPRSAIVRQLYGMVFDGQSLRAAGPRHDGDDERGHPRAAARLQPRYYTPENMTLVVVGPVNPVAVRGLVARTFGRSRAPASRRARRPRPRPLAGGGAAGRSSAPEQQAYLGPGLAGARGPTTPDGDAVDLLTTILAGTESPRGSRSGCATRSGWSRTSP